MRKYIVKIWETPEEREQGLSEIQEIDIENLDLAIEMARKIQEENNYNCVEVQDNRQQIAYITIDDLGENLNEKNYTNAIKQDKINHLYNLVYKNENVIFIDEDIVGKSSAIIETLKNNRKEFAEEYDFDEGVLKEYNDLIREISEYDKDDTVYLYEHPMSATPMIKDYLGTMEELGTIFLEKLEDKKITDYNLEDLAIAYMGSEKISNFNDYGADSQSHNMISLSRVYEDLLEYMNIEYYNVRTREVSDGRYQTVIDFEDGSGIGIFTDAWKGQKQLTDNLEYIENGVKEITQENINKYYKKAHNNELMVDDSCIQGIAKEVIDYLKSSVNYFEKNDGNLSLEERTNMNKASNEIIQKLEKEFKKDDIVFLVENDETGYLEIGEDLKSYLEELKEECEQISEDDEMEF